MSHDCEPMAGYTNLQKVLHVIVLLGIDTM